MLPEGVQWVGCQGSEARYRGYPCAVWTLFHVLTVQAKEIGSSGTIKRHSASTRPHYKLLSECSLLFFKTFVSSSLPNVLLKVAHYIFMKIFLCNNVITDVYNKIISIFPVAQTVAS